MDYENQQIKTRKQLLRLLKKIHGSTYKPTETESVPVSNIEPSEKRRIKTIMDTPNPSVGGVKVGGVKVGGSVPHMAVGGLNVGGRKSKKKDCGCIGGELSGSGLSGGELSGGKALNPWILHLKKFKTDHPELSYREAMSKAKLTYKKK